MFKAYLTNFVSGFEFSIETEAKFDIWVFLFPRIWELKEKSWRINFFEAGKQGVKGILFLSLKNSGGKSSIFAEKPLVF